MVFFALGVVVSAFWFYGAGQTREGASGNPAGGGPLSESSRAVLKALKSPVEIRFYSMLGAESGSEPLRAFADRVNHVLAEYEREADGKIKLVRYDSGSYANANAAVRDGIKPVNADKGEARFLGIALVLDGQRESLPQLTPEWEPALESDVTRALSRLVESTRPAQPSAAVSQLQTNAAEEVKALIPDVASVSVEEGTRLLRESALKEFQASAKDAETRIKAAQQRLADSQNRSEAEQEAARKQLQQVQAEQVEKLKEIAAKSLAQIEAFQRLKSGTP
jgi:ABC-type uncharacterized transport system involved in gliding motility auxiliary subunit